MKKYSKLGIVLAGILILPSLVPNNYVSTVNAAPKAIIKVASKANPVSITSIANINMTVNQNQTVNLPKTVVATMSNKTKKAVAVKWDVKSVSTKKVGKIQVKGTVSGYKNKVVLTVNVNAPKKNNNTSKPKDTNNSEELRVIDIS